MNPFLVSILMLALCMVLAVFGRRAGKWMGDRARRRGATMEAFKCDGCEHYHDGKPSLQLTHDPGYSTPMDYPGEYHFDNYDCLGKFVAKQQRKAQRKP